METIHKYAGADLYQTIPESLVGNALALYTTRPQGLSDFSIMISSDFTTAEMNAIFGVGNHPTAGEIAAMKAYKGKETWDGLEPVVINPNDKYYWPDRSGFGRHLHAVNVAYDATGGVQAGPPANWLCDGVNDYLVFNSATDIVAANGAVSAFVVYKNVGAIAGNRQIVMLKNAVSSKRVISIYDNQTTHVLVSDDATSGTTAPTITGTPLSNTWGSFVGMYDPADKKAKGCFNGGAIAVASAAITNGTSASTQLILSAFSTSAAWANEAEAEVYLFNKVLTQAEIQQLHNNIASRYGLTKV